MKVIMTGGGTGGHIYPAIAIADKIKDEHPDSEILFVGTEKGLEKTLAPQNGYPLRVISATGLDRKHPLRNVKTVLDLLSGIKEAKALIREFAPDIVIGTGGYVCAPVVKAAAGLGVRVFIHEQNVSPGLTNRLLERYAEKVFVGFEEAKLNFKKRDKVIVSGNPVRKVFSGLDKKTAREILGMADDSFAALAFGGSRGAAKINAVMSEVAVTLSEIDKTELFFVTGEIHYDKILDGFNERDITFGGNIHILPYLKDMHLYLSACDLVISRAGALTVTEIMVCGKPAILIPSPNVTGNHQYYNAKALADRGCAEIIEEKDLNPDSLMSMILKMKNEESYLAESVKTAKDSTAAGAVEIIYANLGFTKDKEEEEA